MLELANNHLRVVVADEVGAEIRFLGRPGGENVLAWYEWTTPVPARRSTTYGSSLLDWSSEYRGGWQELFPNAGNECDVHDVPLPFHGEVSRTRWQVREQHPDAVTLSVGARLPLLLERTMRLSPDAPLLQIEESVTNESSLTVPFVWVHHPAFAVAAGTRIDLPPTAIHTDASYTTQLGDLAAGAQSTWPVAPTRTGTTADLSVVPNGPTDRLCYATSLAEAWAALRDGESGVALAWQQQTHPYAWIWTEIAVPTMPSYGRSQLLAIEPASYWPADGLASAHADGRAHVLRPGERVDSWLTIALFDATDAPVTHVERDGRVHTADPEQPYA